LQKRKRKRLFFFYLSAFFYVERRGHRIIQTFYETRAFERSGKIQNRNSPELMKNGIRNRPDKTLSRRDCKVEPSKGNAPQTNTYSTTPSDFKEKKFRWLEIGESSECVYVFRSRVEGLKMSFWFWNFSMMLTLTMEEENHKKFDV
jgi:hypothetical protein